ncbi:hypothetical protein ACO1MO_13965, partial [Staphylococcus aureus]
VGGIDLIDDLAQRGVGEASSTPYGCDGERQEPDLQVRHGGGRVGIHDPTCRRVVVGFEDDDAEGAILCGSFEEDHTGGEQ